MLSGVLQHVDYCKSYDPADMECGSSNWQEMSNKRYANVLPGSVSAHTCTYYTQCNACSVMIVQKYVFVMVLSPISLVFVS